MALYLLRGMYLLLAAAIASFYVLSYQQRIQVPFMGAAVALLSAVSVAGFVILIDVQVRRKSLAAASGLFLGLIAGLLAAFALSFVVDLVGVLFEPAIRSQPPSIVPGSMEYMSLSQASKEIVDKLNNAYLADVAHATAYVNILKGAKVFVGLLCVYIATSLVLQTRDDFRFVVPYVEFARQIRGTRPTVVDTSVLVDARIVDILGSNILQGTLLVPRLVVDELQRLADSGDKLKRARGRRGLDTLRKVQETPGVDIRIEDTPHSDEPVDQQLLAYADQHQARLLTVDFNLIKVAEVKKVQAVNLNQLALAMRPHVLPGETMELSVIRSGEGQGQGVGYLDDGTMVVVEGAKGHVGKRIRLTATGSLQTSAGRMVFGRMDGEA